MSLRACMFGTLLLYGFSSLGHMTSDFDVNVGASSFQAKFQVSGQGQAKSVDSLSSVEMNYHLRQSSTGIAYTMSFFQLVNTNDGYLNMTRFAGGARWYFLGMNGGRIILDNDVTARIWKPAPYLGLGLGLANLSVKEFNASFLELLPRFGAEMPLTSEIMLVTQIIFSSSFGSAGSSQATTLSFQGQSAMLGIIVTNFFD